MIVSREVSPGSPPRACESGQGACSEGPPSACRTCRNYRVRRWGGNTGQYGFDSAAPAEQQKKSLRACNRKDKLLRQTDNRRVCRWIYESAGTAGTDNKNRIAKTLIKEDIEQGKPLSEAMDSFPRVFPLTVRNTVRVGEVSGLLEGAMEQVAGFMEEDAVFRGEIITALIYPAIVFTATLG